MSTTVALALGVVLLAANAFFVAVEFALVASRRRRLAHLAEAGDRRARTAMAAMTSLNVQLAGAQLGITMASLLLGYVAEPAIAHLVEGLLDDVVELPDAVLHGIGFAVALTIVVLLHMVLGEMVPKNLALAAPERMLLGLARPNRLYMAVFGPVIRVLNGIARVLVGAFGVELRDEIVSAATAEELARMLGTSHEEGLLEETAHDLLTRALDLGGRPVRDVMVPIAQIDWVARTATPSEVEAAAVASGHSRLVVAVDEPRDVEDVLGYVHVKDVLTIGGAARERALPLGRVRPMPVIPGATPLMDALATMQRARRHVALVADGERTAGVATLEDVLEALVGDIRDESDPAPPPA